tara:strand:- start:4322 stop:5737 length:1416 start_codon:yes stop_codon:yes gene_type:complete
MTTKKVTNLIEKYLKDLDAKGAPADLPTFIAEINNLIEIPLRIETTSGTVGESYTLSYLLSSPGRNDLGFDYEIIDQYKPLLTSPASFDEYIDTLFQFLGDAEEHKTTSATGDDTTVSFAGDITALDSIRNSVIKWNTESTSTVAYSAEDPKIPGLVATTTPKETEDGATVYGSFDYYSGPNIAINDDNQYIDATTGEVKKYQDQTLLPHFRRGSATDAFVGLSQQQIFILQQQLAEAGLDISSYDFEPGSINYQTGEEISFVAQLMTEANDMISLYPNLNLINKDAPTVMGQLQPYLAWKKKNVDAVNTEFASEIKASFADEILPPTDAEVKSAVDALFAERGIRATAKDYAKYEDIFSNLKKQEASRDIEIENNTLTLSDVVGLSKGKYTLPGGSDLQNLKFGVDVPTAKEARLALGKPLLGRFDVTTELGKIIDNYESGRIDASKEITARMASAQQFKNNFMQFEENF